MCVFERERERDRERVRVCERERERKRERERQIFLAGCQSKRRYSLWLSFCFWTLVVVAVGHEVDRL